MNVPSPHLLLCAGMAIQLRGGQHLCLQLYFRSSGAARTRGKNCINRCRMLIAFPPGTPSTITVASIITVLSCRILPSPQVISITITSSLTILGARARRLLTRFHFLHEVRNCDFVAEVTRCSHSTHWPRQMCPCACTAVHMR